MVTRQGQVTLPKNARQEGEFEVGSIVEFFYSEDMVLIKKRKEPLQVFDELAAKAEERFKKRGLKPSDVPGIIERIRGREK